MVIGPTAAARAVSTVRWISRACSAAAPSGPSTGSSRVLTGPGIGAFARIATVIGSTLTGCVAVVPRQRIRLGAEVIGQAESPHQQDGAQNTKLFPAPPRRGDRFTDAKWT